jgi:hypothetical protein
MRTKTRRITSAGALLLGAVLAVPACSGGDPTAPIDRDAFIEVMIELRLAAREFRDPSAFDSRKDQILADAGVSDSTLMRFVRAHQDDPEYMSEIWERIDEQVNPPALLTDTTGAS